MEITWPEIQGAMEYMQPVEGGFTAARRGIVTLDGGERVFVKQAIDEQTSGWIELEKKAYHWLADQGYAYVPKIIAESPDGFALPDLSGLDWSNTWSEEKLEAAFAAMDALTGLSDVAQGVFKHFKEPDQWMTVPDSSVDYRALTDNAQALEKVRGVVARGAVRKQLQQLAASQPERGDTLIHLDVRADNFCYDAAAKVGYLVDWNWLCLGSAIFDVNALLVSVQQRGFDVAGYCPERLDAASLASLTGFWLTQAALPSNDALTLRRHQHQLNSALTAYQLYEALQ